MSSIKEQCPLRTKMPLQLDCLRTETSRISKLQTLKDFHLKITTHGTETCLRKNSNEVLVSIKLDSKLVTKIPSFYTWRATSSLNYVFLNKEQRRLKTGTKNLRIFIMVCFFIKDKGCASHQPVPACLVL